MLSSEFHKLIEKGILIPELKDEKTGIESAIAPRTGMRITLRPDLKGLNVK